VGNRNPVNLIFGGKGERETKTETSVKKQRRNRKEERTLRGHQMRVEIEISEILGKKLRGGGLLNRIERTEEGREKQSYRGLGIRA